LSITAPRSSGPSIPKSLTSESAPLHENLESQDLSFTQAVRVLRKRKGLIYKTAAVCFLLTLAVSFLIHPKYKSLAVVEIEHDESNALETSLGANTPAGAVPDDAKVQVQTEVTILQSDDLALETIEKVNYEQHESLKRKPQEVGLPLAQAPIIRKQVLKKFASRLTVSPREGTRIILVGFTDRDPKYAALVASTLLDQFVQDRLKRMNSSTLQATEWIGNQIADINKRLEDSQKALYEYQRQSGLVSLPSSATSSAGTAGAGGSTIRSPAVDRLLQLNQSLVAAQTDRISKEAIYKTVQSGNPDTVASVAASQLASNPTEDPTQAAMFTGLMSLRQQQNALRVQLTNASQIYGAKNPHLLDLHRQMQELDRQIKEEVASIISRANLDYQTSLKNETGLKEAYNQALRESGEADGKEGHMSVLQQEADSARALYEDLYTKLAQAKLSVGTQAAQVAVISKPLPPSDPNYPKPILYGLVSIIAGLFIGIALAFVAEGMDDTVTSADEVEAVSDVPVLASIPQSGSVSRRAKKSALASLTEEEIQAGSIVVNSPESHAAEAFRLLRNGLLRPVGSEVLRKLLITSPLTAEGKSVVAYNLGCSLARAGERVLIIDANLRNPSLHAFAKVENARGLSNWLSNGADSLQQLIAPAKTVPNLFVLPSGPEIKNLSDHFQSARFEELLQTAGSQFQYVLFDSPAFMLVSESSALAQRLDATLIVVESGKTTRQVLQKMMQQCKRLGIPVLGAVLNRVNTSSSEFYYTHGFRGSDGEGYHANN